MTTASTLPVLSYRDHPPTGSVPVTLDHLMVGGLLLQAGSGGGKSRAIRQALEETHGRVQHLVIDPEGEFASLREHFDYLHLAPHGGDAVATPKTARVLCRRLVEIGASAVLDIYDLPLDQKRDFVRLFLTELMSLPRSLWKPVLVVIDEADLFAPQQGEASSTEAVIDVNGRGRKRGWRLILTTRRLSKLHKDAADIQNRMIGRTGLDLDVKRAGDELGMDKETRQTLPRLEPGTFYVYGPAITPTPMLVRTGAVRTTHPEAGRIGAMAPPAPAKIKALVAQLADLPKEAEEEARTMDDLRRQVRERDARIRQMEKTGGAAPDDSKVQARIKAAVDQMVGTLTRKHAADVSQLRKALEAAVKFIVTVSTHNFDVAGVDKAELERAVRAAVDRATQLVDQRLESRQRSLETLNQNALKVASQARAALSDDTVEIAVEVIKNEPFTVAAAPGAFARAASVQRTATRSAPRSTVDGVTPGMQKILNALAELRAIGINQPRRAQLSLFASMSLNGGSGAQHVADLGAMGLVTIPAPGLVELTSAGVAAADAVNTPDLLAELHARVMAKLSPGQQKILAHLLSVYPESISRADLSQAVAMSLNGGSGAQHVADLVTIGAGRIPMKGRVIASELLFPAGLS